MDSGLLPLLSCPQLFLFLGLPSPGGSLAPHLDFSQQLPQALQPPARCPSCAPCALPLPVPVGKMWEPWQGQGQGVMAPVEELLAIPSPSPDSVPAGEGTSPLCVSLDTCRASWEVLGARRARRKRGIKKGGRHNPRVTHKLDHHHHKKGNFVEHETFILWNSTRGWDGGDGGGRGPAALGVFWKTLGHLKYF